MTREEALNSVGKRVTIPEATVRLLLVSGGIVDMADVQGKSFKVSNIPANPRDSVVWLTVDLPLREWNINSALLELVVEREGLTSSDFDS